MNHSSGARNGLEGSESRRPLDAKYFERMVVGPFPDYLSGEGLGARWARYQQTKLCNTVFMLALKVLRFQPVDHASTLSLWRNLTAPCRVASMICN